MEHLAQPMGERQMAATKKKNIIQEEEIVSHSREDFNNIIQSSFENGKQDGRQELKDQIVAGTEAHCAKLFLSGQDDLAKEVRNLLNSIKSFPV